jgi:1-deoxy-D-xylulose-5-phosphate synthase
MDRAGIAGPDGPTHHGTFDINYMLLVPHMTVTAPKDGSEMIGLLKTGLAWEEGPYSIRYPRDAVPAPVPPAAEVPAVEYGTWEVLRNGQGLAILAVGTMVLPALEAARALAAEGVHATVVNCRFLKPYDRTVLEQVVKTHSAILTVEEGAVVNGFGAYMAREVDSMNGSVRVATLGIPDRFIEHGDRASLLAEIGLDAEGIANAARPLVRDDIAAATSQPA